AEAAARAEQGVAAAAAFDAPYELCALLDEQAWLACETDPVRARHLVLEALALRRKHGLRTCYADSLEILAALEADAGGHAEAVRLLAAADAARDQAGYPRPPVDRADHDALVVAARAALGAEPFQAAWAEGLRTPVEDRVAALTRGRGPRGRPTAGWDSLTPTEVDVVQLVRIGLSNPEIAARLYVSRSTVKAHLAHIFAKVGVVNRTELATQAGTHLDA
ncbi:MAG TPA: helix-turn-helix transcriptional regulator, partial [Actinoplanes sp.]